MGGATGTLDEAAALRAAESDAYAADGTGALAKGAREEAADALAAATGPVAVGGALTAARATAQSDWTAAKGTLSDAQDALTTALGGADLAALRQTVEDDTALW